MRKETGDRWQQSSVSIVLLCQLLYKKYYSKSDTKTQAKKHEKSPISKDFLAFSVLVIDSNKSAKTLRGRCNGSVSDGEERTGKKEEKEGDAVHPL